MTITQDDPLLLISEVAERCRTNASTVRHWIYCGQLASLKLGRHRMVRMSELRRFLAHAEDQPTGTAKLASASSS